MYAYSIYNMPEVFLTTTRAYKIYCTQNISIMKSVASSSRWMGVASRYTSDGGRDNGDDAATIGTRCFLRIPIAYACRVAATVTTLEFIKYIQRGGGGAPNAKTREINLNFKLKLKAGHLKNIELLLVI